MTIVAENVKAEFLPALKALFRAMDAKVKVKKSDKDILKEWEDEVSAIVRDYKAGKIKGYTDVEQMHKDILNGD
ncbi:hypothetical protein ACWIUD_10240 [Helicobacter sp. 23-1044]